MAPGKVRVGLVQFSPSASLEGNLQSAQKKIRILSSRGARIIALPELFLTPYFCQSEAFDCRAWAEPGNGRLIRTFSALSKELSVVLILPFYEKAGSRYFNAAAVIEEGKVLGVYRKSHIPEEPFYHEKHYFLPGDTGFKVFKTRYAKVGVLICWDQWFPEAARACALQGAEILFYPTAIGWNHRPNVTYPKDECEAWQLIQRSHGLANHVFIAAVNRTGREEALQFWGHSFISGPFGELLAEAKTKETLLLAECDLKKNRIQHHLWPFFRDRRPDLYRVLTQKRKRS